MTQQTINIGVAPNDGTGDPLRTAFTKSNDNFTELYTGNAWTAWTPTISSFSGTITSSTVNKARYSRSGKTITAHFDVTIVNAGSGSSYLQISLPVTASASGGGSAFGRETVALGYMFIGTIAAGATVVQIAQYNGATVVITNYRLVGMLFYESA